MPETILDQLDSLANSMPVPQPTAPTWELTTTNDRLQMLVAVARAAQRGTIEAIQAALQPLLATPE